MRKASIAIAAIAAAAAAGIIAAMDATAQPQRPAAPLQQLAWLAGCWAAEDAEPGSGETWMAPAGGTMFGVSRSVKNGRTVAHEFMQIRESAIGRLVFVALPSGQKETSFPMVRLADREVVFENAAHDFPQRVVYALADDGRLRARIEGQRHGEARMIHFPFRRVDCPAGASR